MKGMIISYEATRDYKNCAQVILTVFPIILWNFLVNEILYKLKLKRVVLIFFVEYITIIFIIIFNLTVLNEYILWINIILIIITTITYYFNDLSYIKWNKNRHRVNIHRPSCITLVRSSVSIFRVICILASKFKVWSAHFDETTTYGITLTDTGLGLLVFCSGIVWKQKLSPRRKFNTIIVKLIKDSYVLFVFIILDVIAIKLFSYNEYVIEYGRLWTEIITILLTKFIGNLLAYRIQRVYKSRNAILYTSLIIIGLYEAALNFFKLYTFIFDTKIQRYIFQRDTFHDTFFKENRDGIFQTIGFVGLYLLSIDIGQKLRYHSDQHDRLNKTYIKFRQYEENFITLLKYSIIFWITTVIMIPTFGVSRKCSNSGYIMWISALSTSMLILYMFYEKQTVAKRTLRDKTNPLNYQSLIMISINHKYTTVFILSSLFVAFLKEWMNLDKFGKTESLYVLCAYAAFIFLVAVMWTVRK